MEKRNFKVLHRLHRVLGVVHRIVGVQHRAMGVLGTFHSIALCAALARCNVITAAGVRYIAYRPLTALSALRHPYPVPMPGSGGRVVGG